MKIVLLSGGSGKRLWPLSNGSRTKQFLKVLKGKNGEPESMVQRVWRQLQEVGLADCTYITTNRSQVDLIRSQLGNSVPLIVEPETRDTFPAVALVSAFLSSVANASEDETVCVLPVDPYVETVFFDKVKELESILHASDVQVALIGSKPTYPSEKYGYIIPANRSICTNDSAITIEGFVEKPSPYMAQRLIEAGALWNCGIFAFKLQYVLGLLREKGFPTTYPELTEQYYRLPKNSFDYEVLEKTKHMKVIVYEGDWKDLGTWNTLTEEMNTSIIGKGVISTDSSNSHVVNELNIPVLLLGLSNVIVAVSSDGILVSNKAASSRIKDMIKSFEQIPMYEELRWGWYRILDFSSLEGELQSLVKKVVIKAGESIIPHWHKKRKEIWTIQSGTGLVMINGRRYEVRSGDSLQFPAGTKHSILAIEELTLLEVQIGNELIVHDEFEEDA